MKEEILEYFWQVGRKELKLQHATLIKSRMDYWRPTVSYTNGRPYHYPNIYLSRLSQKNINNSNNSIITAVSIVSSDADSVVAAFDMNYLIKTNYDVLSCCYGNITGVCSTD